MLYSGPLTLRKCGNLPTDSQDYQLGRKVGWITIPQRNNPDRIWICTGFLVGPDLFMTNYHCIEDDFGLPPACGCQNLHGLLSGPLMSIQRAAVSRRACRNFYKQMPLKTMPSCDWTHPSAILYGWLQLDTTTQVDSSQSVKIIQHPRGRSKEIVRRNSQIVDIPAGHPLLKVFRLSPWRISQTLSVAPLDRRFSCATEQA